MLIPVRTVLAHISESAFSLQYPRTQSIVPEVLHHQVSYAEFSDYCHIHHEHRRKSVSPEWIPFEIYTSFIQSIKNSVIKVTHKSTIKIRLKKIQEVQNRLMVFP